ncbi:3-dehydroquinate synthase [Roseimaritima sediminicola]|uniref:3-dehydroquinate synthase n=1 Tax=Roseimaritima sediminicola TaxID=2662066 RepID=UPI0012984C34|nr:3-dehydroquinate synthase [Roseimaritima sediminicola]
MAEPTLQEVAVSLSAQPYSIFIGSDWWSGVGDKIRQCLPDMTHAVLVYDSEVRSSWAEPLGEQLRGGGVRVDAAEVLSGESSKSVQRLEQLWEQMRVDRADRHSVVIAVGGGVVGDLAGFAAATFNRGIRLVQVPTTLLSQVDSSVGGKTGINLPDAKNIVGAFWQPSLVAIDTATLTTLPPRIFHSGLAEVAKYGVIADEAFFAWLEQNAEPLAAAEPAAVRHAVAVSCQTKAAVVAEDERETSGRRAILNYGHTFGHAIEATAGYWSLLHGEAVAIGMQMAAHLAQMLGRVDNAFIARQHDLLTRLQLPVHWPDADPAAMLETMRSDKKVAHGKLRFVLPTRLGHVELVGDIDPALIVAAIEKCCDQ